MIIFCFQTVKIVREVISSTLYLESNLLLYNLTYRIQFSNIFVAKLTITNYTVELLGYLNCCERPAHVGKFLRTSTVFGKERPKPFLSIDHVRELGGLNRFNEI